MHQPKPSSNATRVIQLYGCGEGLRLAVCATKVANVCVVMAFWMNEIAGQLRSRSDRKRDSQLLVTRAGLL